MGAILHYQVETEAGYNVGYRHGHDGQPRQSRAAAIMAGYSLENTPEKQAFLRGYRRGHQNGQATLEQEMQQKATKQDWTFTFTVRGVLTLCLENGSEEEAAAVAREALEAIALGDSVYPISDYSISQKPDVYLEEPETE